jgi:hypothetical protein
MSFPGLPLNNGIRCLPGLLNKRQSRVERLDELHPLSPGVARVAGKIHAALRTI